MVFGLLDFKFGYEKKKEDTKDLTPRTRIIEF
jgi:hypothetical protein